jgi:hypothetical protein
MATDTHLDVGAADIDDQYLLGLTHASFPHKKRFSPNGVPT